VGRLVPGKGVQYLLEAIPRIRRAFPDLIITIVGDGPYRPELERLCASLELITMTRFIGSQPRSRLSELYAETDVVVIPSLSEVFPYVALEAAAAGTPIVATTVGGIPEILANGAVLVPPGDAVALADGILTALSDPSSATARARLSQDRSLECFKFETMVDRAEAVYADLLKDRCFPITPYPPVLAQPHRESCSLRSGDDRKDHGDL
jgi:glycogen(starch) synthase